MSDPEQVHRIPGQRAVLAVAEQRCRKWICGKRDRPGIEDIEIYMCYLLREWDQWMTTGYYPVAEAVMGDIRELVEALSDESE